MILLNGKEVEFEVFPNGESKLIYDSMEKSYSSEENVLLFKYRSDGDLIRLAMVKDFLDYLEVSSRLVMSYMPYSRMDRGTKENPHFTLKVIGKFINNLNFLKVYVIEPHSDVTGGVLDNYIPYYINFQLLPLVEKEIGFDKDIDFLFFPDAGAQKRYNSLKGYKQLVGHKNRDFNTGEITGLEVVGDLGYVSQGLRDEKILIVDDLCSKGGTFLHSANKLKELGFWDINLLVAHCENSIFQGELLKDRSSIRKIFTTDSILTLGTTQIKTYKLEELL
jgi:ribose-phosphate pyrophosphokinase